MCSMLSHRAHGVIPAYQSPSSHNQRPLSNQLVHVAAAIHARKPDNANNHALSGLRPFMSKTVKHTWPRTHTGQRIISKTAVMSPIWMFQCKLALTRSRCSTVNLSKLLYLRVWNGTDGWLHMARKILKCCCVGCLGTRI